MKTLNTITQRTLIAITFVMLSITLGIVGQLPTSAADVTGNDFVTVYPTQNADYFSNPGIGFQRFEGFNPAFLEETVIYPDRSDISWRVLNPSVGTYDWSTLDNKIASAARNGQLASFRVYTMRGESYGGHQVPQWVVDRDSSVIQSNGAPNYDSCSYQTFWASFVDALRQRYDGDSRISFIDISGYGNFNEWSWQDETVWDDNGMNPASLDGQARVRLADMFIGGSDSNHQCETSNGGTQTTSYSYSGFQTTQLVMPYAGIQQTTRYVASRRADVGIRYDCLGSATLENPMNKIGDVIESTWRNAPIIFEFCAGVTTSSSDMQRSDALINAAHPALVHENLAEPRNEAPVRSLLTDVGYRYQMAQAVYDSNVSAGETLSLTMAWQNVGTSPAYPRMGYDFRLHVYLLDSNGNMIANHASNTDVSSWMPANPLPGTAPSNVIGESIAVPGNLADGTYQLRVAILNVNTGQPINLAITGADQFGRYAIGDVTIGNSSTEEPVATEEPVVVITQEPVTQAPDDYLYLDNVSVDYWIESSATWATYIDVYIRNSDNRTPSRVIITGVWSDGTPFDCETSRGWCGIRREGISASQNTISLTITDISRGSRWVYYPTANVVDAVISIAKQQQDEPSEAAQPVQVISQPTTAPVQPTTAPVQPTTVPVQPTTVPVQPTTVPVQPTTVPVQPTTVPVQPTTVPVQPTTVPVQPTTVPVQPTTVPVNRSSNGSVHIANLDAESWGAGGGKWALYLDITVADNNGRQISGVTVTGRWSDGTTFTCVTDGGWCGVRKNDLPTSQQSITFTVVNLSHPSLSYNASANTDPDANRNNNRASNGTVITINL